jgi:alpha-beta hydrolase superfamily lysophospholipase
MTHEELAWGGVGGQRLHAQEWRPEATSRAVVCLVHGLGEHAGRYAHVAQVLAEAGCALLAFDLRGHGRTPGPRGHAPSYDVIMGDIGVLLDQAKQRFPGAARFLYGHSMGGSLVLNYGLRRWPSVAGVVATSPGLQPTQPIPRATLAFGRVMGRVWPSFRMSNGLDCTGLSRDADVVRCYRKDPLVHDRISARLGLDLLETGAWAIAHAGEFRLPLLLAHGTADSLTAIEDTRQFAAKVLGDCTLREWPGLYHETHNEPEWREVLAFTIAWMGERVGSPRVSAPQRGCRAGDPA